MRVHQTSRRCLQSRCEIEIDRYKLHNDHLTKQLHEHEAAMEAATEKHKYELAFLKGQVELFQQRERELSSPASTGKQEIEPGTVYALFYPDRANHIKIGLTNSSKRLSGYKTSSHIDPIVLYEQKKGRPSKSGGNCASFTRESISNNYQSIFTLKMVNVRSMTRRTTLFKTICTI